jgi:hypothetical protein
MGNGDKPKSPAKPSWAPPSLSIRVKCAKSDKHPLYGLFVILRMATPGPGHSSLDKVVAVHDGVADKPAGAAKVPEDASAVAVRFICTIVDREGFLVPVHDAANPWREIFPPDLTHDQQSTWTAQAKMRDMARIPVDTDGKFVGCLVRHPQPSLARDLTHWLNMEDDDRNQHGFAAWKKPRSAPFPGETSLKGRELLAHELTFTKDTSAGTQLVLLVDEDPDQYLPPKLDGHGGWLLYQDMPHRSCDSVIEQVKDVQRKLGILRYPIGTQDNIYLPGSLSGQFEMRTLSAVLKFQQDAAAGKVVKPFAWPGDTSSTPAHDWTYVTGKEIDIDTVSGTVPGCVDGPTWAAVEAWLAKKVRRPGVLLTLNPDTYMRWEPALAVIAWKALAKAFGVNYAKDPKKDDLQISSGYSIAELDKNFWFNGADPHKSGFALDCSVIAEGDGPLRDFAHPRPTWPIHFEAQWWAFGGWAAWDPSVERGKRDRAKATLNRSQTIAKQKLAEEEAAKAALEAAQARHSDVLQTAAEKKLETATTARAKADEAVTQNQAAFDKAQADLDAAQARLDREKTLTAADRHTKEGLWNIRFRLYGHSSFDVFGDKDNALDALYASVDGVTERVKASLRPKFGTTPREQIDAFLDANLAFLAKVEESLKAQLGPKEARGAGREAVLSKMFRASVRQWNYNPYSRAAGEPGPEVKPSPDTGNMDELEVKHDAARNSPAGAKSFVNLTYLGWLCGMRRIGGWGLGAFKDPSTDGKRAPRAMYTVSQTFGKLVGFCDRMRRSDSDEKMELIVCDTIEHHLTDLDIDFMIRWAKALFAMRPRGQTPVVVTTWDPRVTLEFVATDPAMAQLQTVFDKLDESGSSQFVLMDAGKNVLEAALLAQAPSLVEADKGKFNTGKAWREKIENVAKAFKKQVATTNAAAADKAQKPAKPVRSVKRDPKDWQLTLQPVFEKTAPAKLEEVSFQPSHKCTLAGPGSAEGLEWWHFQHSSSGKKVFHELLKEIGYEAEVFFEPVLPPEADDWKKYNGRGMGAPTKGRNNPIYGSSEREPENFDSATERDGM